MHFQKSPLLKKSTPQGWCFFQTSNGQVTEAWSNWEGTNLHETVNYAAQLVEKSKAQGAYLEEIPAHYRAQSTGIDLQVHLRFPGQAHKETLLGGLESAVLGGYDSIVTMPNTNPYLDNSALLEQAIADCAREAVGYPVRIGFTASATIGMLGEQETNIAALAKAGAVAITDDGWGVKSDSAMLRVLQACAESDLLFQQHAEMPGHMGVATASSFQTSSALPVYPRSAESEMIRRDIALLKKVPKARYHVLHVSTRESLEEIRKAKEAGLRVTAEVSPHHLFFSNADIPPSTDPRSSNYKMNPPLFDPEDRIALVQALRIGLIDCVSTDHAPHEAELKAKGWNLCPFGTRGMETALPTLLTLEHRGFLTPKRVNEVFHLVPRKILDRKEFAESTGILFVDTHKEYEISQAELPGISQNSCFLGSRLQGRVEIRGENGAIYRRS